MLARILQCIALILALSVGAVLLHGVTSLSRVEDETIPVVTSSRTGGERESVTSRLLAKLPLLPRLDDRKRLVAFMIENHEDARWHQEGLSDALLVEEIFVEGLISRFIAVFDHDDLPSRIGPVRSLRPYFLDGILPWVRTVFYAGGSPKALERVESEEFYGFNGLYYDDPGVLDRTEGFHRKAGAHPPHDLFVDRKAVKYLLSDVSDTYLPLTEWPPYPVATDSHQTDATTIRVNFFNIEHNVRYNYSRWTGSYSRTNGRMADTAHPRNVLILETGVEEIGPYGRLRVDMVGEGNFLLFRNGSVIHGTWARETIEEPYVFRTTSGNELAFAPGQIWMMIVPTLERVSWE